jgi:hypothetical protein
MTRRRGLLPACVFAFLLGSTLALPGARAQGAGGAEKKRELRQMQIYRVNELGLEIWVENQPPWQAQLSEANGRPTFVAESPPGYHPPTVMTYASWPNEKVPAGGMHDMASSAIRRASQNFGVSAAASLSIPVREAQYGDLRGYEGWFNGKADGVAMDVSVFVGQAPGKFPVVFNVYTVRGKLPSLTEQLRRAWTNVKYLPLSRSK